MPRGVPINLEGQKFGRWTVLEKWPHRAPSGAVLWLCECECTLQSLICTGNLRCGHSKGCQSCASTGRATTHGMTGTPAYRRWEKVRREGACKRWDDLQSFYDDVGDPPNGEWLLKKDISKPWGPSNWKWGYERARIQETVCGITKSQKEWAKHLGISRERVRQLSNRHGSLAEAVRVRAKKHGVPMARIIEDWDSYSQKLGRDRSEKYPWQEWFDGEYWELTRGEDFDLDVSSFRHSLYAAAKRYEVNVRSWQVDDDTLVLKAF